MVLAKKSLRLIHQFDTYGPAAAYGLGTQASALEATQEQIDALFSPRPYKCHLKEVASVWDCVKIRPPFDSRVIFLHFCILFQPTFRVAKGYPRMILFLCAKRWTVSYWHNQVRPKGAWPSAPRVFFSSYTRLFSVFAVPEVDGFINFRRCCIVLEPQEWPSRGILPRPAGIQPHIETLMIDTLTSRKFTTQIDLYQ